MESAQHALLSASCLGSPHAHLQALDQALFQGNPPSTATTLAHPALHLPAPTEHSWSSVSAASPEMNAGGAAAATPPMPPGALVGAPQFRCTEPDCGRIFKRKTSLTNHLKAHRNPNSRSLQRSKRQREAQRAKAKAAAGLAPPAASASQMHPLHAAPRNPCLAGIEAMGMLAATPASAPLPPPSLAHHQTPISLKPTPIIKKNKRYLPNSPRLNPILSRAAVKPQETAAHLHPLPLQLPIGSAAAASTSAAQPARTVAAPTTAQQHQSSLSPFTLQPTHQTLHHHLQYAQHRMQQQQSTVDRLQSLLPHSLHALPIPSLALHTTSPYGIATSPVSATAGSGYNGNNGNLPTHPTFASTANYDTDPTKYEGAQLHATQKYQGSSPTNGYGYSPAAQRTPANPSPNPQFMEQPFEMPVGGSEAAIMGVAPCFTEEGGLLAPLDLNFLDDSTPAPTGAAVGRGTMEPPATADHLSY